MITVCVFILHTYTYQQTGVHSPEMLNPVAITKSLRGLTSSKQKGYIVSFHFYEQQTQALHNFFQFQCMADKFGMKIVEPFLLNSMFAFPFKQFPENPPVNHLKLSDLIDLDIWNQYTTTKYGYLPVSDWNTFLREAPRRIIVSCIRYRKPPKIKIPKPGFNFRYGCTKKCFNKFNDSLNYLSQFGFKLVRKSCSNFVDYAGSVSVDIFKQNILGNYDPNNVTVFINEFRGLFGLYRLPLRSYCGIDYDRVGNMSIFPSSQILNDAQKYSTKVFKGKPYISIIARVERVALHLHHNVEKCAQEVQDILLRLMSTTGTKEAFLSMDVGKFGSRGALAENLRPKGEILFRSIYGHDGWMFEEWEESFVNITSSENPAFVANLQRTIAARGECLIMFGGGGFQAQARNLYEKFHPDKSKRCVYKVCDTDSRL